MAAMGRTGQGRRRRIAMPGASQAMVQRPYPISPNMNPSTTATAMAIAIATPRPGSGPRSLNRMLCSLHTREPPDASRGMRGAGFPTANAGLMSRVSVGITVGAAIRNRANDWSEWQDLNLRPPRPERGALPDCATLRRPASPPASGRIARPARSRKRHHGPCCDMAERPAAQSGGRVRRTQSTFAAMMARAAA